MKIINFEKKKIKLLTKEQQESKAFSTKFNHFESTESFSNNSVGLAFAIRSA